MKLIHDVPNQAQYRPGNGDYMPTEASVLYDHTLRQAYQSYDLYGVAL